jgi:hypothetical protein
MRPLLCLLGQHDWLWTREPGHLYLCCQQCGAATEGLRGPIVPVQPPVVRKRKLRKATSARVVRLPKARRTA